MTCLQVVCFFEVHQSNADGKELMHEFRDCNKCCSLKQLQGLTQAWMKMSVVVINCW